VGEVSGELARTKYTTPNITRPNNNAKDAPINASLPFDVIL
jgi:hypothetical protein